MRMDAGDGSDGGDVTGGAVLMMLTNDMLMRRPPRVSFYATTLGTASTELLKANANGSVTRKLQKKAAHHPVTPCVIWAMGWHLWPLTPLPPAQRAVRTTVCDDYICGTLQWSGCCDMCDGGTAECAAPRCQRGRGSFVQTRHTHHPSGHMRLPRASLYQRSIRFVRREAIASCASPRGRVQAQTQPMCGTAI